MDLAEYARFDGVGLHELLVRGAISPVEIGHCIVAGIERVNPALNAVIEVYGDSLASLERDWSDHPLRGLPTLTKDLPVEGGRPAEFGSRLMQGYVTANDDAFWKRLRAKGLVNFGRTTTSEFAIAAATETSFYGSTANPWNTAYGVAGSGGGAAASVAAGIVPFAQGSDGGGSIRNPASFCGLVGLKPTRGRVSGAPGANAPLLGLATAFFLTRTVRDAAWLLDHSHGPFAGDGYEIPPPAAPYASAIRRPPERLRIALSAESWSSTAVDPEIRDTVLRLGTLLQSMGHHVEEAAPRFAYRPYIEAQKVIWAAFAAHVVPTLARQMGRPMDAQHLQTTTRAMVAYGERLNAADLFAALETYDAVTRTVGEFLEPYDVLVAPTCPRLPDRLGTYFPGRDGIDADRVFADLEPKETFTALFNATGSPALSVPFAISEGGLPIGLQLVANFGRDDLLLALAAAIEAEVRWHDRRPPVHIGKAPR